MSSSVLKVVLNVTILVCVVLGALSIGAPIHAAVLLGLALFCAVSRAVLVKLEAIHTAIEQRQGSPANNPPSSHG